MSIRYHPTDGAIVTYVDREHGHGQVLRHAVVLGPELDDPETHEGWLPVLDSDRTIGVIDASSVVDVAPARVPATAGDVLDRTREALDAAIRGVATTADAGSTARLLVDFVVAIRPVQHTVEVLVDAEPTGALAAAVCHLVNAANHMENGDATAGRAAIDAARLALRDLAR